MELSTNERQRLWQRVKESVETCIVEVPRGRVTPVTTPGQVRSLLESFTFEDPLDPVETVDFVVQGLLDHQVHVSHPGYFGLFNPPPTQMGIAGDTLAAAFNPQLATWHHSPFAIEIEQKLIRSFGEKFGYNASQVEGSFVSGGTEANHTALLTALMHAFPDFKSKGLRGLDRQPTFYVSLESHHSLLKAGCLCGLGRDAARLIPVDVKLRMDVEALALRIERDKAEGFAPFMVASTAGATNSGVIDPLPKVGDVAQRMNIWHHVDAAWGGAVLLSDNFRGLFEGVAQADSITFDAHKWMFVPMGAGLYLTRHKGILRNTFEVLASYMPPDASKIDAVDPYTHSMQCSRRFIGLKVFLSLAVAGWDGYAFEIKRQVELGHMLRKKLEANGWIIVNHTDLPLVCFVDGKNQAGGSLEFLRTIQEKVLASGRSWISIAHLSDGQPVIRACICNFRTTEDEIHHLVKDLEEARLHAD